MNTDKFTNMDVDAQGRSIASRSSFCVMDLFYASLWKDLHLIEHDTAEVIRHILPAVNDLKRLEKKCESPIELRLLPELLARLFFLRWIYPSHVSAVLFNQTKIFDYRVDFFVNISVLRFDDGKENWHNTAQVIVECDGFDYHERTIEQAIKDRKRDRSLQSDGFLVFRYMGSEIYNDARLCGYDFLRNILRRIDAEHDEGVDQRFLDDSLGDTADVLKEYPPRCEVEQKATKAIQNIMDRYFR